MSDSYTVLPLKAEIRDWLIGDEYGDLPIVDGRDATLAEVKGAIAALPDVVAEWSASLDFPDALLSTPSGLNTMLIVGDANVAGTCEFHFRGGHEALVELVVSSLSKIVGPLVIHAHSGSFTKVIHTPSVAPNNSFKPSPQQGGA